MLAEIAVEVALVPTLVRCTILVVTGIQSAPNHPQGASTRSLQGLNIKKSQTLSRRLPDVSWLIEDCGF